MIRDQQTNTIQSASKRISTWFQQKIDSIEVIGNFVKEYNHKEEFNNIKKLLINNTQVANFKNIYIGYEDNAIISGLDWIQYSSYVTTQRPWYKNTSNQNKTIVTAPYIDVGLNEVVVSLCTPIIEKASLKKGVICGILPLEKIKNEILDISLPYDGIAYVVNYYGKIILHPDSNKHLTISDFKGYNKHKYTIVGEELKERIFSQDKIENSNWYIVAQLDKSSVYEKINTQLLMNLAIYTVSLLVFLLLNYFYYKREKHNEDNLIKTKAILRHFVEHGDYGIIIEDHENQVIYHNELFLELLQQESLHSQELNLNTSNQLFNTLPKTIQTNILKTVQTVRQSKHTQVIPFKLENKEQFTYYRLEIVPVMSRQGIYQGLIIFYKDVTAKVQLRVEQKEHEAIMFQQSKMADLGEMIAAVSHQWRQPLNSLSIMLGNLLQFKQTGQLSDEIFEENLQYSMSNIHYLAQTIDTFRNFYQPNQEHTAFNISEATKEVCEVIMPHLKTSDIQIKIENSVEHECKCLNYKNEYQQIIINLLHNAKDAILEDRNNPKHITVFISFKNHTYFIEVHDFGNGISKSFQPKLFQSFQTTKKDKGTGKGLYISKLIAKRKLKGELSIKSYGKPTIFLLSIPCQEEIKNARQ